MKYVGQTKRFKRALKKLIDGKYRDVVNVELSRVVKKLANDEPLDWSYYDHPLTGNLKGFRECHLAFGLVLIYKLEEDTLELARIGSHSEVL